MPEASGVPQFLFPIARAEGILRKHGTERVFRFFGARWRSWNMLRIFVFRALIKVALRGDSSPSKVYE